MILKSGMQKKLRRLKYERSQAGDTLVSITMSIAVISLVIVIAYALISNSLRLSLQAREREQVKNLVQGQIESLKYLAFQDSDGTIFDNTLHDEMHGFCLFNDSDLNTDNGLPIGLLVLDPGPPEGTVNQLASEDLKNSLRPAGSYDVSTWVCEQFATLEAANVKVKITYKLSDDGQYKEHLFTVEAKWDRVGGSGEEMMTVPIRISPPRTN